MTQVLPYIYIIGAAQGFILSIALLTKKVNVISNRILSVWLLFMVLDLAIKSVFINNIKGSNLPYLFVQFFPFLYGGFFYLYVRTMSTKQPLQFKDAIHFTAFIVFISINIPAFIAPSKVNPVGLEYFDIVLYISSIGYVVAGIILIVKYRKNLSLQQADIKNIDLQWLMIMGYCQIIIWLIAVTQWLIPIQGYNFWIIYIAVSLWITLMGYLSLAQQNVAPIKPIKQSTKPVNKERMKDVGLAMDQIIVRQKIYLQPNLSIGHLAKSSGYPEYLISLYINRSCGMNFHDYINNLRIKEAEVLLQATSNKQTILDVAYTCGYNSKSTFNNAFKKITHLTPSQFRQQQAKVVGVDVGVDIK